MDSWAINYTAIRVSRAVNEVVDAIDNDKELADLASYMVGLGYHTNWLGLEMQKPAEDITPERMREIGQKLCELGLHYHKHGGDLQAIAISRMNSQAAD